jgi:hypothetical protein
MAARTDLLTPHPEKVTTVPGQEYGKRTAQEQSQRILPLGPGPAPAPAPTGGPVTPQPAPPPPAARVPGDRGDWTRPTERPNEPLTTGLPTGPGPGPEGLTGFAAAGYQQAQSAHGTVKSMLQRMAANPVASDVVRTLAANT